MKNLKDVVRKILKAIKYLILKLAFFLIRLSFVHARRRKALYSQIKVANDFSQINSYLEGEKFSNGLQIKFQNMPYVGRMEFLEKISKDKSVIHIGFADHKTLIHEKIKNNTWLHKRLIDSSKECVGIDVNCETVKFVANEIGIPGVYCLDILKEKIPIELCNKKWDYIIVGELLEHIDDPVAFLKQLKEKMGTMVEKVVITVPNAFRYTNFYYALIGKEVINTDHRYWFTPYTVMKVLTRAGINIESFYMAESYPNTDFNVTIKNPLLRDDIIVIGRFS